MRTLAPSATPPRLTSPMAARLAVAGAAALLLAVVGACANPDTQTPTCTNNVDSNGLHPVDNACEPFASCPKGAPAACCVDADGGALTGNDLATCLYGYGGCAELTSTSDSKGNVIYTCESTAGGSGSDGG